MGDNYSWYSAAKSHPFWPNGKEPSKFKTFDLYIAQIPDGSTDCFVPPLIVFWPRIVPDNMFRMNQWSVKIIKLHSSSKENRASQWHCFSLLNLIPQGGCFWVAFIHFSHMQQTFIETLVCSRQCIRYRSCKKNWHSPRFWSRSVYSFQRNKGKCGKSDNMWRTLCWRSVGERWGADGRSHACRGEVMVG